MSVGLVGIYLYNRLDEEVRRHAEKVLSDHYQHLNVTVGGARVIENRGLAVYDISLSSTEADGTQSNVLLIEEMFLACNVELYELVRAQPEARHILLKRPQLWLTRRSTGVWSLASLFPPPACGTSRPTIKIENAEIVVSDDSHRHAPPLVLQNINLNVEPTSAEAVSFRGGLASELAREIDFAGTANLGTGTVALDGNIRELDISPRLQRSLATFNLQPLAATELEGQADAQFSLRRGGHDAADIEFAANIQVQQATLKHPRLPQPLTDLQFRGRCDNRGWRIDELVGKLGRAQLVVGPASGGWHARHPVSFQLRCQDLKLTPEFFARLPAPLPEIDRKFQPVGLVSLSADAHYDGQQWSHQATITCDDVSFTSADKFPYRLTCGTGTILCEMTPQHAAPTIAVNLQAVGGGQPVAIEGRIDNPGPRWHGRVFITAQQIPIDETLLAAVPQRQRHVIRSLQPQGAVNVRWRAARDAPGEARPQIALELELVDCGIQFEKFPYPLRNIRGTITAADKHWSFQDLTSRSRTSSKTVRCQGRLVPRGGTSELRLEFSASDVPLDEALRRPLQPHVQQAWQQLQPSGQIDLTAVVTYVTGGGKPVVEVAIRPNRHPVSIRPLFFPYRMKWRSGVAHYHEGRIVLEDIRASHDATTITTQGQGNFQPDGSWRFWLTQLSASQLSSERELRAALPPALRQFLNHVGAGGSVRLYDSTFGFAKRSAADPRITSRWDVSADCFQIDLDCGIPLENIHGRVRLEGAHNGNVFFTSGDLNLDSVQLLDTQFTEVRGPLWADEDRVMLGHWATQQQALPLRPVTASAYGGAVQAHVKVDRQRSPSYAVEAHVSDAQLSRFANERLGGQRHLQGRIHGHVSLSGFGTSIETLGGQGTVQVADAEIYQLPLLVGLLKVLRHRTPDTTAFNECNMRFSVRGQNVSFEQLDFEGDAVSLYGQGEVDFDHNLNLAFSGVVGRNDFAIPFIKDLVGRTSEHLMRMSVRGQLDDPQVHTQAFPGVNGFLQQIKTELEEAAVPVPPERTRH